MAKQIVRSNAVVGIGKKPVAKKLKCMAEKLLHRGLSLRRNSSSSYDQDFENIVPEDVKEGHFAVLAVDGNEPPKRFVVPLSCLTHPIFISLLEQAAEEYGFSHEGALEIPCGPDELNKILLASCDDDSIQSVDAH